MSVADYDAEIAQLEERLMMAEQEESGARTGLRDAIDANNDYMKEIAINALKRARAEIAAIKANIATIKAEIIAAKAAAANLQGGRRKRSYRSKRRVLKKRHTRRKHRKHRTHRKHRK